MSKRITVKFADGSTARKPLTEQLEAELLCKSTVAGAPALTALAAIGVTAVRGYRKRNFETIDTLRSLASIYSDTLRAERKTYDYTL